MELSDEERDELIALVIDGMLDASVAVGDGPSEQRHCQNVVDRACRWLVKLDGVEHYLDEYYPADPQPEGSYAQEGYSRREWERTMKPYLLRARKEEIEVFRALGWTGHVADDDSDNDGDSDTDGTRGREQG